MNRNSSFGLWIILCLVVSWGWSWTAFAQDSSDGSASGGVQVMSLPVPVSEEAAPKIDPRIRLVMARTEKSEWAYAGMGRAIVLSGESVSEIRFPVLIRTSLSDEELAGLGAIVESRAGDIVTAEVLPDNIDRLASHPGVHRIEASYWLAPSLDVSIPEVRANLINESDSTGFTGTNVIFGLIDDGIDITHQDFMGPGGSRVLYVWDQHRDSNNTPPAGYTYGHEYTKADIDGGQASQFVNTGGHGSHVAGIAVGDGSSLTSAEYRGVAWNADIIAVRNGACDLFCYGSTNPLYSAWQGSGTTKGSIDALNYILDKAGTRPLVVNQSQGVTMGPHDGTTLLEQAYQNLIDTRGLIITIAAGNDQQRDWHGRATVSPGGQVGFTINKDNSEQADQWLWFECWGKQGDRFRWEVMTPGGQTISIPAAVSPANQVKQVTTTYGDVVQYWSTASDDSNDQPMFLLYAERQAGGVQGGNWQVNAIADNALPSGGQVDLYCERNQYTISVTSNVSTQSIVGMPGTTTGAITVASYNSKNSWDSMNGEANPQGYTLGEISRFSSHGPRRDGAQKPDIAAPGAWLMSAFAAGSDPENEMGVLRDPGGSHICYSGTSMSAPHVAGAIALMLQKQGDLTPAQVKTILQETARADAYTGAVPNYAFGYGKLDVKAAVDMVGGGPGACATVMGDADGNTVVDILDLVATVNHILDVTPLSAGGQACADVQSDGLIDILDVVGIVNTILNGFAAPPVALGERGFEAEPVAWSERAEGAAYRLTLDGSRLGGVQLTYYLPRGYAADGKPVVLGGKGDVCLSHAVRGRQHTLILYMAGGGALSFGNMTLEIPLRQAWDGGQEISDLGISHLVLADPSGRHLRLAPSPSSRDEAGHHAGMGIFLERTIPNPSVKVTSIEYVLEANGEVTLTIFDASGRRIRDLWNGWQMAGSHVVAWDGRDDSGLQVTAGVYFAQLRGETGQDARKILVIR